MMFWFSLAPPPCALVSSPQASRDRVSTVLEDHLEAGNHGWVLVCTGTLSLANRQIDRQFDMLGDVQRALGEVEAAGEEVEERVP